MLARLVYASSAARPLEDADLTDILQSSRRNNAEVDVTGALFYSGGNFMQVLEGPADRVAEVYRRVEMDRRHHGHSVLLRDPIGTRQFPDAPMAFHSFAGLSDETRQRARSLFDPSLPDRERARLLLQTLRELVEEERVRGDGSTLRPVLKRAE